MRINDECLPCTLKTALQIIRNATEDEKLRKIAIAKVAKAFGEVSWNEYPIELAYVVHGIVREVIGVRDPYKEIKRRSNDLALSIYPKLKKIVEDFDDKLEAAARLAIAGNAIDFCVHTQLDLEESIEKAVKEELKVNDYGLFKERVSKARTVIYFLDNAGEIVFDKLLLETMLEVVDEPYKKITIVARGGPLLNDSLIEDVRYVGLDKLPNVELRCVSNGEEGTGPPPMSDEVRGWIKDHDLAISKGQANYEILHEVKDIFLLLIVKCPVVAESVGAKVGDLVLKYSG